MDFVLARLSAIGSVLLSEGAHAAARPEGYRVPELWSFLPFLALLLVIAIFPLVPKFHSFWEKNRNRLLVALLLACLTMAYYAWYHPGVLGHDESGNFKFIPKGGHAVLTVLDHAVLHDYIPFIVLLFSLYTISGGIFLRGDLAARPVINTAFIGIGGLLASFIGTTGASMLLIRPLLRTNQERRHIVHTVIFFIFVVSNIGGCLTPLGDPPLFLGLLRGVPFWWTLNLFVPWAVTNAAILGIYFIWDSIAYGREERRDIALDEARVVPLGLQGKVNFLWLLGVIVCVATLNPAEPVPFTSWKPPIFFREGALLLIALVSWVTTPGNAEIRRLNKFNFHAINEVACLFIGIFICMQAPVEYLREKGPELGLDDPHAYFWVTGSLSSFLDNAPTYAVFFETAKAVGTADVEAAQGAKEAFLEVREGWIRVSHLMAISLGAVFLGAMTYIGNGPNFMVKAIAESRGVRMPSFFGYMVWSVFILVPLFLVVTYFLL